MHSYFQEQGWDWIYIKAPPISQDHNEERIAGVLSWPVDCVYANIHD